jgi:hypothetical protein
LHAKGKKDYPDQLVNESRNSEGESTEVAMNETNITDLLGISEKNTIPDQIEMVNLWLCNILIFYRFSLLIKGKVSGKNN